MDFLRRACNICRMKHISNYDVRRKTGRTFTTAERIESGQLLWYGHVMRMEEKRWPKKALTYTPQNRKRKGRLTTQWRTGIRKSMRDRATEDDDWKDREKWRSK